MIMTPSSTGGFAASGNLYCVEPTGGEVFFLEPDVHDHAGWSAIVMTDSDAMVLPSTSPACTSW